MRSRSRPGQARPGLGPHPSTRAMAASAGSLVSGHDVVVQVGLDDLADAGALAIGKMAVAAEGDEDAGVELVGHPDGIFMRRGGIPRRTDNHNGCCPAGRDLRQLGRRSDGPQRTYQSSAPELAESRSLLPELGCMFRQLLAHAGVLRVDAADCWETGDMLLVCATLRA